MNKKNKELCSLCSILFMNDGTAQLDLGKKTKKSLICWLCLFPFHNCLFPSRFHVINMSLDGELHSTAQDGLQPYKQLLAPHRVAKTEKSHWKQ